MRLYFLNILKWLDEGGNVWFIPIISFIFHIPSVPAEGRDCYTISQWSAELRERNIKLGCIFCALLTWVQNSIFNIPGDHCTQAMDGMPENVDAG